jgi:bifunctional UDP-N-acetylglucosamine pyrophosphorylase/glucosamine-1-phosphate N-acetyltransferase
VCLKGFNSIGRNCEIGGSSTLKNSILFDDVKAKHLAYIGDSVVGEGVNFGSGTQVANYRFDAGNVNVLTERGWVNSGRKKLGAIIGDGVRFGVLSCTMPGKLIGNGCWVGSGVVLGRNLEPGKSIFQKHEYVLR